MHNKGFFNLTKISYTKVNALEQDIFVPGEGSFSYDLKTEDATSYAIQTINGYFFNPYISLGLGLGIEGFNSPNINTLPIFADVRVYLQDDYSTPFAFLDIGGMIKASDNFNQGNMFALGAGYKFFVGEEKKISLVTDVSFSGRNISLTDEAVRTSENKLAIRGVALSFGIIF